MQHRQRHSFTHPDTGHHSYSPRHENRACSFSVGFSQNHSSLNLGPVCPKAIVGLRSSLSVDWWWNEAIIKQWCCWQIGTLLLNIALPRLHSHLALNLYFMCPLKGFPLSMQTLFSRPCLLSFMISFLVAPILPYFHSFLPSLFLFAPFLADFFSTSFIYSLSTLWFYFLPSHFPISFFCSLSGKMYLWIWLIWNILNPIRTVIKTVK